MPINPIFLPAQVAHPIQPPALPKSPELPSIKGPNMPPTALGAKEPIPEVILVSGVNYPHKRGAIKDGFGEYCKSMATKLHRKYPGVKVTAFSFFKGTQEEYQFKNNVLVQPVVVKNFGTLKAENYRFIVDEDDDSKEKYVVKDPRPKDEEYHTIYFPGISELHTTKDVTKKEYLKAFNDGKLKEVSLSVADIYKYIESIGKDSGTIKELHMFSHAFIEGPVFANTKNFYEWNAVTSKWNWLNNGKFLDKDGRTEDFGTVIKGKDFGAAFAIDAFSMIWGCNAYASPKQIVNQTRKFKEYNEMVKKPDKELLELKFIPYNKNDGLSWGEDTEDEFHELVFDTKPYTTGKKSEKKSLNDIKKILQTILDGTYMKKLAKATKSDVLGALPGTYANFDQPGQKKFGMTLMHVPMGEDYNDGVKFDFRPILEFYQDHFGIQFKPDGEYDKKTYGRGYAVYMP